MLPPSHHGRFVGENRLWLMPGTPVHRSEGTLEADATGLRISWAHDGKAQHGTLRLRGPAPSCRADLQDSFHAADGLVLHGCVRGTELYLYATYPAGDGSPDWGWRIELDWSDPEHLTLRMFNLLPDGTEALAVELRGARA